MIKIFPKCLETGKNHKIRGRAINPPHHNSYNPKTLWGGEYLSILHVPKIRRHDV
jgi:hypothetical protein